MQTTLNSEMLVVVGPMGRDVAAFTDPADALEFASVLKPQIRDAMHYRRPDGATMGYRKAALNNGADFMTWAVAWTEA